MGGEFKAGISDRDRCHIGYKVGAVSPFCGQTDHFLGNIKTINIQTVVGKRAGVVPFSATNIQQSTSAVRKKLLQMIAEDLVVSLIQKIPARSGRELVIPYFVTTFRGSQKINIAFLGDIKAMPLLAANTVAAGL